jgi:hypothetical protein
MTARTRTHRCPPDHAHAATLNCYTGHSCGCDDCVDANRLYVRRVQKLRAYGRYDGKRIDATPVAEHINYLRENGIGSERLGELCGVSYRTVQGIVQARHPTCLLRNAERILSVKPSLDALAPGAFISSRGVQRRMQALCALGWTQQAIAAEWGMPVQRVNYAISHDHKVTARVHRQVAELYNRMSVTLPPREGTGRTSWIRTRARAARKGWHPPLAWDDIDNDPAPVEVEEVPSDVLLDVVVVEMACDGRAPRRLLPREKEEVVRRLNARGLTDPDISSITLISERHIFRIRAALGVLAADNPHNTPRKEAA